MSIEIVLISIGIFQEYIIDNIIQLLKLNMNIHVITNKKFFIKLKEFSTIKKIDADTLNIEFDSKSKLDKSFRNGFWNNCSKRLFLLYEYIKKNNIKNVVHLENDVLLYSKMEFIFENKIYLTMDSTHKCVPGIIYIPSYELMNNLINNYNYNLNDMTNMSKFYNNNKNIVKTFPIIDNSIDQCIYNENFKEFNSIFDGAAMGQYLGGVDPRNRRGRGSWGAAGFVNKTCVIKYNKYQFKWIKKGEYSFPHIEINNKLIPINNLHIHCKNLKKFSI